MSEQSNKNSVTNTFTKGMAKDYNESFVGEGFYTHARNAVDNSHDGQIGILGNEPANLKCVNLPYTFIGSIPLGSDEWAIFTTDNKNSEIGIFDQSTCTYTKKVNDPKLGFKTSHLIVGAYRKRFDCNRQIYWDDALNPSRTMDIDNPPYITSKQKQGECYIDVVTTELDVEKLRLAPLLDPLCFDLQLGRSSGTLLNGSYQVTGAYTVNGLRITDYFTPSQVQGVWTPTNSGGSLEITLEQSDEDFDEFELVIISVVNQQTVAKRVGIYSTRQKKIYIDTISPELITVSIGEVCLQTPTFEKSDGMYEVNNYLIRTGIYTKYDFNYQPLANKIKTKWVAVQYPADYYEKGGNNPSYMRDEQYAFFIRWVYNTGDKSASYHIPGRPASGADKSVVSGPDNLTKPGQPSLYKWQVYNTATITSLLNQPVDNNGIVVAEGEMGYWESTEIYPDNKPEIWDTLCGEKIRHHKFPDNTVNDKINHFVNDGSNIVVLGVKFENISHPLDENGNPIESIIGYEIMRGSREGQKTIVAKGMFNNMREYTVPNSSAKGLYQNFPYNDLRPDYFHSSNKSIITKGKSNNDSSNPLTGFRKDIYSFHSPETSFSKPYLTNGEVKIYSEIHGTSEGFFENSYKHPRFKQMADSVTWIAKVISSISALRAVSKGVQIKSTEKIPIDLSLTPGSFPRYKSPAGGDVTGAALTGVAIATYAVELASWALNMAAIVKVADNLRAVQQEKIVELFKVLIPRVQYSAQYNSHGFYNKFVSNKTQGNIRRNIDDLTYVKSNLQSFGADFRINNLYRGNYVAVKLDSDLNTPSITDNSRNRISEVGLDLNTKFNRNISAYYGAIKVNLAAQYGQLDSIKILPASNCVMRTTPDINLKFSSDIIFGGDVYINRFTEKNPFMFFNDWLLGQPDEYEHDYRNYINIPYPRYWIENREGTFGLAQSPSDFRHLDAKNASLYHISKGYFYISYNGVRDFFVESEVNLAYRESDDDISKKHYDPNEYTDISMMFRSDIVKSGNYYKYDYSLSASRLYNNFFTWSSVLPRDYDPKISSTCYSYYPNRAIYSLPQQLELKKDNWKMFLVNNYYDFNNKVTTMHPMGQNGALILLENSSPKQFIGVDQLQTTSGVKLTIGDGGLFSQPLQNVVNADSTLQYGGCQSKYGVVSTPEGLFWVSQKQGRIFTYGGSGVGDITESLMKYWFREYLPSKLLEDYPQFELYDNPVTGVGCMLSYDNTNAILYVSKRDYKVREQYKNRIVYLEGNTFLYNGVLKINLDNAKFFEDVSFTASYNIKKKAWISFHDWHPEFVLNGPDSILTVKNKSIWRHGVRCDKYCNFYDTDYPFEVEFVTSTGQQVTTVKSVEYILEAYKFFNDCRDKHHILDTNFDRAIVYNSEQISGTLNLRLKPKNDPVSLLNFPYVQNNTINIHYSKEENKYRFNQFWDITRDRGEFYGVKEPMFITNGNGYTSEINQFNVRYSKPSTQHKKFRHYANRIFLRKLNSGDVKMLFKLNNTKFQLSPR